MSTPATTLTPETMPQPSIMSRVINTFIAPSKAFVGLDRKAGWLNWLVPFLIIAVFSCAYVATVQWKVGFDKVSETQMKMSAKTQDQMERLTPEDRAKRMEMSATVTKYISWASPLMLLIFSLIIAGVLLATFNFGMGMALKFGTVLSVVMYSWLPSLVRTILTIAALVAGMDPEGFNIRNPVATNHGFLVDATAHPALYALASALDIAQIWVLIVAGIGFAVVARKKRSTMMGVVFGWWAVMVLVGVAMAAIFA